MFYVSIASVYILFVINRKSNIIYKDNKFNIMLHNDVISKYLWTKVDYDGSYGYQCTDWSRQYCKETGNEIGNFSWSALNWWTTWSPFDEKWQRVSLDPKNPPKEGSVIFFDKTKSNPYGHVAVVDSSNSAGVCFIEQNAGNGNGDGKWSNAIKRTSLSYSDTTRGKILWWFTLKNQSMETEAKVSEFKQVYIQERPRDYKPRFTDFSGSKPATISDVKYLIEIARMRESK